MYPLLAIMANMMAWPNQQLNTHDCQSLLLHTMAPRQLGFASNHQTYFSWAHAIVPVTALFDLGD